MIPFVISLGFMSLQAALITGAVLVIRKLSAFFHIPKKCVLLFWAVPFFFLVFPWKITVPESFGNPVPAEMEKSGGDLNLPVRDVQIK